MLFLASFIRSDSASIDKTYDALTFLPILCLSWLSQQTTIGSASKHIIHPSILSFCVRSYPWLEPNVPRGIFHTVALFHAVRWSPPSLRGTVQSGFSPTCHHCWNLSFLPVFFTSPLFLSCTAPATIIVVVSMFAIVWPRHFPVSQYVSRIKTLWLELQTAEGRYTRVGRTHKTRNWRNKLRLSDTFSTLLFFSSFDGLIFIGNVFLSPLFVFCSSHVFGLFVSLIRSLWLISLSLTDPCCGLLLLLLHLFPDSFNVST